MATLIKLAGNSELNQLTEQIIGVAIEIHKQLGPGFAEKVYQRIMYLELKRTGLVIKREHKIIILWDSNVIGYHVVDFLINNSVIIEIKATGETQEIHKYQLLSYLKAANKNIGLLLNFGSGTLGIKRVINDLK